MDLLRCSRAAIVAAALVSISIAAPALTHSRIRAALEAVPAIDTHSHLHTWPMLHGTREALFYTIWRTAYTNRVATLPARQPNESAGVWWSRAAPVIANVQATGFFRYKLAAFRDLYGVDFEAPNAPEIDALPRRVADHYGDRRWLYEVITERANIELMITDPYWARYDFVPEYPFEAFVFNVTPLLDGFHASEFTSMPSSDPYRVAQKLGLAAASLEDYLALIERMMAAAKAEGAVALKTTRAYDRTLRFENVPHARAAAVFGRPRTALNAPEIQDFQDFIMWRLVELAAKHHLPFQIHTGHGRLQGSNPLLLLDLIQANPQTKFVLFHGGYPWVGETGAIAMQHWRHVWVDTVWLPTISPTIARRALHEWLEVMPSNRLLWGSDCFNAETIYAAAKINRAVIAEVLAEKVERGDLREPDALRIGRQILRENALELYPALNDRLWKHRARLTPTGLQAK
jgi:predicted TIM-barrel fold metal-dependent hydrolase